MKILPTLAVLTLLPGCGNTPQTTAATAAVVTLASLAAANNTTAAAFVQKGALLCGQAASPQGVLIGGAVVAIANAAGVPVSVIGQVQSAAMEPCNEIGLVAGGLPAYTDPATVTVEQVGTTLPAIKS